MTMSTSQQIQAMVSNSARSCSLPRFLGAHNNGVNGKEVKSLFISDNAVTGYILSIISMKQELKEPFYVLDLGMVASIMNKWCGSLPNVCPFYAVKCNPDPELLRALAVLGANFDCASQAEIESILALGVSTDRIIYANPCKAEAHIKYAARIGVNLTTFDSRDEIEKIRRWHPKCSLLLRIKPLETDETMRSPLGRKYGALPEEITPLLEAAQAADVSVVGVAFHVGSGGSDSHVYHSAIAYAKAIFDTASKLGMPRMHVLDIGGGFTVGRQFDEAAVTIKKAIDTYFPSDGDYGGHGLTLISEPGRFFAETPFTLVTNVIGKRVRRELHEYWINDGIYGSMNCIINDHATVSPTPLASSSNWDNPTCGGLRTYPSTVFGPTCDAFDTVLTDFQLPELQVNDWLVFPNMGAYAASTGSKFNGFDISAISTYPYMVYKSNLNCHKDAGIHEQNYN